MKTKDGSRKKRAKRRQEVERKGVKCFRVVRWKLAMRTGRTVGENVEKTEAPERQGLSGELGWGADLMRDGSTNPAQLSIGIFYF